MSDNNRFDNMFDEYVYWSNELTHLHYYTPRNEDLIPPWKAKCKIAHDHIDRLVPQLREKTRYNKVEPT